MAVLVRSAWQLRHFEKCFIQKKIPYRILGGRSLYSGYQVNKALALLRCLCYPTDNIAFETVARTIGGKGIGEMAIHEVKRFAEHYCISSYEGAMKIVKEIRDTSKPTYMPLARLTTQLDRWQDLIGKVEDDERGRREVLQVEIMFCKVGVKQEYQRHPKWMCDLSIFSVIFPNIYISLRLPFFLFFGTISYCS